MVGVTNGATPDDNLLLNIQVLEKQPCTCCEKTWTPCQRCIKLVELRKGAGIYPYSDRSVGYGIFDNGDPELEDAFPTELKGTFND